MQLGSSPADGFSDSGGKDATSFSDLVARLRRGDATAAEQFAADYGAAIRREVRFMLLDSRLRRIVSESDVCQSVLTRFFVELFAGKYDFADANHLVALLKKMVRSRIIDLTRHWTAQRRDIRKNVAISSTEEPTIDAAASNPSRTVANGELLAEVRRRLSAEEQTILNLRQAGLAWATIADRLGGQSSPEAVRKRYDRGLARISKELGLEGESI
jgi:RNA polymerase sigma factor (sigma-70 family)